MAEIPEKKTLLHTKTETRKKGPIPQIKPELHSYSSFAHWQFQAIDDTKTLSDAGFTSNTAKAQSPAEIGLAIKEDGQFEELVKTAYSSPPELPDVMKPGQEPTAPEQATA